jgi:hypothetical protein
MVHTISLLTDFGLADNFVAVMKAVILKINPDAKIIDICHNIEPYDILGAGFILESSYKYFPKGTVHLVVVDPGVGSKRKAILVKTEDYFFLGPDNGIFSLALKNQKIDKIIQVTNSQYFLKPVSNTFHGRDIFAPVAAWISKGVKLENLGSKIIKIKEIDLPQPQIFKNKLIGEIIYIDRFGNLISNIGKNIFDKFVNKNYYQIIFKDKKIDKISKSYSHVKKGSILATFGSFNRLEISLSRRNAERLLKAKKKDSIIIQRNV